MVFCFGPPLELSVSDQLLEELAGRIQKWTPPRTLTPPRNLEEIKVANSLGGKLATN